MLIALALSKKEIHKKKLNKKKLSSNLFEKNYNRMMFKDYIVVTEESSKPGRIPDICKNFNIKCIKLLEMISLENWTF